MIATELRRPDRPAALLILAVLAALVMIACAGCTRQDARPTPPETAAPAPPPAAPITEDRGHRQAADTAAPASEQSAFSNVESGEAERAASQRGHQSAGEQAPATPRSGE